jgi:hypothetical protein
VGVYTFECVDTNVNTLRKRPGPAAAAAFKLGMLAAAVLGLAVIGVLYWTGAIDLLLVGYGVLLLFPVYMVVAASVVSVWLGYAEDTSSLRPVYRDPGLK